MKLSLKLPFLFLSLSLTPLAVVGCLAYQNGRQAIRPNSFHHLNVLALQKEGEPNLWFNLLFYFTGGGE